MRQRFILMLMIIWAPSAGMSPARAFQERVRTYHVLHYSLDLRISISERQVGGTVTIRFCPLAPLSSLELDADQLQISAVKGSGAGMTGMELPFVVTPTKLTIALPRQFDRTDTTAVEIAYSAKPTTGLFFVRPDSLYPKLPLQAWSQGEMEQNHFWFPCYDYPNDKATVDMHVTVDENLTAISNGALLSLTKNTAAHTTTYFWYTAKPISSYLISVIVGDYVQIPDRYKLVPLSYNVYPSQRNDALRSFHRTPEMMAFFSEKTGFDFPWPKYSQTVVSGFTYGGMENASATTLTDRTIHNARAELDSRSDNLVAHELAHQWFGDLLTCRNWSNAWLNEGFATYFEALYNEASLGRDDFEHELMAHQHGLVLTDTGMDRRATVTDSYADPEDVFDSHIYARGACILNMLRFTLGDRLFWEGIRHYVDLNQYECVTTDDFQHAMEDVAKKDLEWFFDEWTLHAGFPDFLVSTRYDSVAGILHLEVDQRQHVDSLTPFFKMPVAVEVVTESGDRVQTVSVEAALHQSIELPLKERPLNIVFDEGNWILKKLEMQKPLSMWMYQLAHGDAGDREIAADSLGASIDTPAVLAIVSGALKSDTFWGVRQKAAEAVGNSAHGLSLLAPAFSDTDARVRATATACLKRFQTLDALVALGNLFAHDSSYAVEAEALGSLVAIDPAHAQEYCDKGMTLDSHNDVIRGAATKALASLRTVQAKSRTLALTAYGQPPDVRSAAIDALVENWPADAAIQQRVKELVSDRLFAIRRKAIERISDIGNSNVRSLLQRLSQTDPNPLLRREARRSLIRLNRTANARLN
jgi:aminopeptidase N